MSAPHLQIIMKVTPYLQSSLADLLNPTGLDKPNSDEELIAEIRRLTLSKKFRKYSVGAEPLAHIEASIRANVLAKQPIKFTLPFGAYKLWRLEEAPEADWAELFAMLYFTRWLGPICDIYEPGVWFDFFSDDVIVPKINNIAVEDLEAYRQSFQNLLRFMQPYQPKNLSMTLTRVIDRYDQLADFERDLAQQSTKLASQLPQGLPVLDQAQKATIELNVKTTPEQESDSLWREKVQLALDSYGSVSKRRPYYRDPQAHKIMVVMTPLWGMLCVGSTKDSIMKFWVGAGVLKPQGTSYRQMVYSPHQLEKLSTTREAVTIKGLSGQNFSTIRVLQ